MFIVFKKKKKEGCAQRIIQLDLTLVFCTN